MDRYFDGVKVGDKVWDILYGWLEVVEVYSNIDVFRAKANSGKWYDLVTSIDGLSTITNTRRTFWDEVKIIPPPRPKRKVVKTVEGYINIYQSIKASDGKLGDDFHTGEYIHKTPEEADANRNINRLGKACYIKHQYEVEE